MLYSIRGRASWAQTRAVQKAHRVQRKTFCIEQAFG